MIQVKNFTEMRSRGKWSYVGLLSTREGTT